MINPGCLCVCARLGPPTDRVARAGARQLGDGGSLAEVGGGMERREPVLRGSMRGRTLLHEAVAIRDAGVRVCVRACVRVEVCVRVRARIVRLCVRESACVRACICECARERARARVLAFVVVCARAPRARERIPNNLVRLNK